MSANISLNAGIVQPDYPGVVYASIRVRRANHQHHVSLLILHPGKDYIESEPCADKSDAEAYALELGAALVGGSALADMVYERRQHQQSTPIVVGSIIRYRTHPCNKTHSARVYAIIPGGVLIETGRGLYRRWVWNEQIEGMEG